MNDEITMDSPTERHKSRRGLVGWRLVAARKVGREYHVDEKRSMACVCLSV
jgi:hypothetical protein